MRPTWPHSVNDYTFRVDGTDAGRCYLQHIANGSPLLWRWVLQVPPYGDGWTETLDEAKARFKAAFERLER
jgi:hypothetical protein